MFTLIVFLVVIAILVLSHEFGHFIVAKMRGIRVDEFGFGFPPRVIGKKFGETVYSLNLLPFGGFVKIYGEDALEESADPRNFSSRSIATRFWIIFAGVAMNFLVAYFLFSIGHAVGLPTAVDDDTRAGASDIRVQIVEVVAGSPAAQAGLLPGDTIAALQYAGERVRVTTSAEVQTFVAAHVSEEITVELTRGAEMRLVALVPRRNPPPGEGALGSAMIRVGIVAAPWYRAPWEGAKTTLYTTLAVGQGLFTFFKNLATGNVIGEVAGPVGIARVAGDAGRLGFVYLLQLTALLSVNLGILNLLPIPALDGGRILFLLIEKIRGTPVSARISQLTHAIGFAVLILLMLFITYRDIVKIL